MLQMRRNLWVFLALGALSSTACTVQNGNDDDDPQGVDGQDEDGGRRDDEEDEETETAGETTESDSSDDEGDAGSTTGDTSATDETDSYLDGGAGGSDAGWAGDAAALIEVPNVVGLTEAEARAQLEAAGLTVGTLTDQASDAGAPGTVLGQSVAAGEEVASGTAIDLVVVPAWDEQEISDELDLPVYPPEDQVDETVGGIDENGDGVRDDVERDLGVKYWPDRKLIAIIDELVKDDQIMLTNPGSPDLVSDALERKKLALGCLETHFEGDLLKALEITGDVAAHVLDTADRLAASRQVESALGGQVVTLPTAPEVEEFCNGLYTPELAVDAAEAQAQNDQACVTSTKTVVVYSNSILTRHDKALINGMALRQKTRTNAAADEDFIYKLAFVDSDGIYAASGSSTEYGEFTVFGDFIGQGSAEQIAGFNHYQSGAAGIPAWIKASLDGSEVFSAAANVVADADVQSHAAAYSSDGTVGNRVFIVGHGLGALYANAAYDSVVQSLPALATNVRVLGVGTPAENVAGDSDNAHYVTLEEDTLVAETLAGLAATKLIANATNATDAEPSGHEFLQSYVRGDGASVALQALLDGAISEVEAPTAIATDGIITVTLTWGEQPDVDLHATEPDGTHVFYSALMGTSGALDLDDTSSFGPEHYTVSCANLAVGTYSIGLNYFRGDLPETATVNIDAGGQTRTFTVVLDTARSTAGDAMPLPVADIVVSAGEDPGSFVFQVVGQVME
jgi:uncharacterized protein YfaP (DUF2135 family)